MSPIAQDAKVIFLAAVENSSPDDWPAFLDEACGGDRDLRECVEGLLQAHAEKDSLFDRADPTEDYTPVEQPGQMIGPYKLRERLGVGGMGVVWAAEQRRPLRRKVAIKVIKPGMDTSQVIARFEAERDVLSMMDHPNVARVLDAGTTEQGRPYFVMELIHGIPITEYCDAHKLTVRERLELFVQVCRAVQHAHQKGIIHRDLKPSNVLVTEQDGQPVPKVIDFGVAKALSGPISDRSIYTGVFQAIGTLAYMSPEQASLSGTDVDTRADVYGLGALLYELLTATPPFDATELKRHAIDQALRIVREQDAPKPSTRLSTLGDRLSIVSQGRRTDPAGLGRQIRGDLDWIVMKALAKDRPRRYDSASRFAEDVQRFLSGDLVEARPPSVAYRLQKFARRNKALLATATTITLIFFLAAVVSSCLAIWALRERGVARSKENEAIRARDAEKRQVYNLTIGHAFGALAERGWERLDNLLTRVANQGHPGAVNTFEYRLLRQQYLNHEPVFDTPPMRGAFCASFTPDGSHLAVGTMGPALTYYEVGTWKEVREISIEVESDTQWHSTTALRYLPNTERAVIGGRLLNGKGGWTIFNPDEDSIRIHRITESAVTNLDVALDGTILVATDEGNVESWRTDEASPRRAWEVTVDTGDVPDSMDDPSNRGCILLATNGESVAVAAQESYTLTLLNAQTRSTQDTIPFEHRIRSFCFSRDLSRLAVSLRVGIDFYLVDEHGKAKFKGRIPDRVHALAFSPDDSEVAAADAFGGVRFFSLTTRRPVDRLLHNSGVNTVKQLGYAPDGSYFFSIDVFGSLKVWSILATRPASQMSGRHGSAFHLFATSPRSDQVAIWNHDRTGVRVWKPSNQTILDLGDHPDVFGLAFSPDATMVATCGGSGGVRVWNLAIPGKPILEAQTAANEKQAVAFSPDGSRLAYSSFESVFVWELETDQLRQLRGVPSAAEFISLDFSNDGRYLVAGGGRWIYDSPEDQGVTLLWDLTRETDEPIHESSHPLAVYAVDFHPTRHEFASGGLDSAVRIYNVDKAQESQLKEKSWWVTGLAYSPDGTRLVTVSPGQIRFWDAESFEQIGTFEVDEQVRRVAFLADGTGLVTASTEGFVRVWKALPRNAVVPHQP